MRTVEDQRAYEIVKRLFKNDYGEPFEMTDGQIALFRSIYERQHPRTQFECYTQYGKSSVVAIAVLLRATTFSEKWIILGGSKEKAEIIMKKIIKHIFDNEYTLGKFQVDEGENLESIKRERSKDRVTFKVDAKGNMGEIFILSADARKKSQDAGDILIGHGSPNLIIDDAALIPDMIYAKALRMLGGHKDNFLLKITNSFGRNHAYRSRIDPKFHNIVITYEQGIKEGRITSEFIDEARRSMDPIMFGSLYECVYPPANMIEEGGWMPLLTEEEIEEAMKRKVVPAGMKRMGCDIAEGINYNAFVIRYNNYAFVKEKNLEKDLMKTADRIYALINEERVHSENTTIDAGGSGSGVYSRLNQMDVKVNGIKFGEKATEKSKMDQQLDPIEFSNMKAQMFWELKKWIQEGGALENNKDWLQIAKVRYKEDSDKRIKIMPKEEMKLRGLLGMSESTDIPDALALTFAPSKVLKFNMVSTKPALPFYPELGL